MNEAQIYGIARLARRDEEYRFIGTHPGGSLMFELVDDPRCETHITTHGELWNMIDDSNIVPSFTPEQRATLNRFPTGWKFLQFEGTGCALIELPDGRLVYVTPRGGEVSAPGSQQPATYPLTAAQIETIARLHTSPGYVAEWFDRDNGTIVLRKSNVTSIGCATIAIRPNGTKV